MLRSGEAFLAWINMYRALSFTDFTVGWPGPQHMEGLRRIASDVIPALRRGEV